jgi:Periplasmic protease
MRLIPILTLAAVAAATAQAQTESPRARVYTYDSQRWNDEGEHRAALGVGTSATGTLRDTLGVMVTSVTKDSPAERAGIEEGNRLSAINGVSLRANAADIEDAEMSGSLTRRLTRELAKVKAGDEVELRVYRDGRTSSMKIKTADSDSLFRRREMVRFSRAEMEDRPVLGLGIGSSGSRRDSLGVLVISVGDSTPAARAGIEEGNRIAAINGVNLRVNGVDAGDRYVGAAKAQRLNREVSQLKPGSEVTLRVYSNGQFRDVRVKVARAGDLPRDGNRGMMFFGDHVMPPMPPMAPMIMRTPMPRMAPMPPMPPSEDRRMQIEDEDDSGDLHFEIGPAIQAALRAAGESVEKLRPEIDRVLRELPDALNRVEIPRVAVDISWI